MPNRALTPIALLLGLLLATPALAQSRPGDLDGDDAEVRVSHPDEARRAAALDAVLAIVERDQYRPPPSRGNTADRGRRDEF